MSRGLSLQAVLQRANYAQPTKQYLNSELSYLLSLYPSLLPEMSRMSTSDVGESGTVRECVSISGTLRVPYRGNSYNVPVKITYFEGYPTRCPLVTLHPTPDMVIKPNEYVDQRGNVVSEIMKKWSLNNDSTLLVKDLIAVFSYKMPVFAKNTRSVTPTRDWIQRGERVSSTEVDTKQFAGAVESVYSHKAEELISDIEELRADRKSLRASQESTEAARNGYVADMVFGHTGKEGGGAEGRSTEKEGVCAVGAEPFGGKRGFY